MRTVVVMPDIVIVEGCKNRDCPLTSLHKIHMSYSAWKLLARIPEVHAMIVMKHYAEFQEQVFFSLYPPPSKHVRPEHVVRTGEWAQNHYGFEELNAKFFLHQI